MGQGSLAYRYMSRSKKSVSQVPSVSWLSQALTEVTVLPCVLPVSVGIYTSNKDPISHGGSMLRAVCSTPLSSSLLGAPGTSALPRLSRSPYTSTLPSSSTSISTTQVRPCSAQPSWGMLLYDRGPRPWLRTTPAYHPSQVFPLAGSTFSLPSTHIFGTSVGTVNPLLTQAESSHTGRSLDSCPHLDLRG